MLNSVYCELKSVFINYVYNYKSKMFFSCGFIGALFALLIFFSSFYLQGSFTIPNAYGHAFVIDTHPTTGQTLPKSPLKVEADINEPVDLRYSKISVVDSNGERVDNMDLTYVGKDESKLAVTVPKNLPEGTYTASVQMLSQIDGHLTQDTFVFGVGKQGMKLESSASQSGGSSGLDDVSVGSAIARFPALVGQVMIVGSAFCMLWLWKPIVRIGWLDQNLTQIRKKIETKSLSLMLVGAVILVLSDFVMIISLALSINASIIDAIGTKFGTVWLGRSILSLVLLSFISFLYYSKKKEKSSHSSSDSDKIKKLVIYEYAAVFVAGICTLMTTSLMGHAAAVSGNFLYISLDFIHNLAASLWIGGVIYLAFVVVPLLKSTIIPKRQRKLKLGKKSSDDKEEKIDTFNKNDIYTSDKLMVNSLLSIIIPRFSFVPIVILGTILLTGPFLLYILENDLSLTLNSLYGKVLVAKLTLAAIMIIMGAYYQIVIHNRSVSNLAEHSTTESSTTQMLSKSKKTSSFSLEKIISRFNAGLKAEAIVGILLLGTVAVLTSTGLPESETGIQGKQTTQDNLVIPSIQEPGYMATEFLPLSKNGPVSNNNIDANSPIFQNNSNSFTKVQLSIDPFLPGNNKFIISFLDPHNNPVDLNQVKLKMTNIPESSGSVAVSIAPIQVTAKKVSPGVFSANSSFGFNGQWRIEVEGISNQKNTLNLYAIFDPFVKPSLSQMDFNITEFKTSIAGLSDSSANLSQPLYPVYDKSRNVIWVGDTILNSGRILEFDLDNNQYLEHKVSGVRLISQAALDSNNDLWYLDPLNKLLGHYNPQSESNENFKLFDLAPSTPQGAVIPAPQGAVIPSLSSNPSGGTESSSSSPAPPLSSSSEAEEQGAPSAIDIDSQDNVWIAIANTNIVLKYDPTNKNFTKIVLPSPKANPLGIAFDKQGSAWIAEGGAGKIAQVLFQGANYTIKEFSPNSTGLNKLKNGTLQDPMYIRPDPSSGKLYISEHEGDAISIFDPATQTFDQIKLSNKEALPFGMVFDKYHNLWIAEHLTNKITVIDPNTKEQKEVEIPTTNPFIQYLATDGKGQVWVAEQRGNALSRVDVSISSAPLSPQSNALNGVKNNQNAFESLKQIGFEKIAAPLIAIGIILVSLMYIRTVYAFSNSIQNVRMIQEKKDT
ncbi:MAG: copper resistance protein CopC [Candidatus Nitrosocosmicus sp.]|nr:copper resistance protein CopC [Candidatus Nitrosocosmicus sp.]